VAGISPALSNGRGDRGKLKMHQTKKGNHWHFGMKAHIGIDSRTRTIRSITATANIVIRKKKVLQLAGA